MSVTLDQLLFRHLVLLLGVLLTLTCSDSSTQPIKELAPFVGVWTARSLTVSNPDQPGQRIDIVEQGASYKLSILSTGQYTSVYDLIIVRGHEAGKVEVDGNRVTLLPTSPPGSSTSGTWMFQGDVLLVQAVRLVDFDDDGVEEAIDLHFEFVPVDQV
jgi:hypothetical protein